MGAIESRAALDIEYWNFTSISPGKWRDISRLLLPVFHPIFHYHITISFYSLLVYSTEQCFRGCQCCGGNYLIFSVPFNIIGLFHNYLYSSVGICNKCDCFLSCRFFVTRHGHLNKLWCASMCKTFYIFGLSVLRIWFVVNVVILGI
jgi:hypothetical protein